MTTLNRYDAKYSHTEREIDKFKCHQNTFPYSQYACTSCNQAAITTVISAWSKLGCTIMQESIIFVSACENQLMHAVFDGRDQGSKEAYSRSYPMLHGTFLREIPGHTLESHCPDNGGLNSTVLWSWEQIIIGSVSTSL